MADPRLEDYARLLVERCVDVQPGEQIVVRTTPLGRPLAEEVVRAIARRGAYALPRVLLRPGPGGTELAWATEAPDERLGELAPIVRHEWDTVDGLIAIDAPENLAEATALPPERTALLQRALAPIQHRIRSHDLHWVGCQYPTPALAQAASISVDAFADFLFGAVLVYTTDLRERLERIRERFDAADTVRVVGAGTDLTFSLGGRGGRVDDGTGANVPGGEVFYSPVEDSAEGQVSFAEFPAVLSGREAEGVRLVFRGGRVVEASAARGEDFLLAMLDADEGARRLGEFGIGGNPNIRRHMRNTLFDEKMDGTIHLAIGGGFPELGGTNESAIHWDMVKDLRAGGELWCDGEVVQRDGDWLL